MTRFASLSILPTQSHTRAAFTKNLHPIHLLGEFTNSESVNMASTGATAVHGLLHPTHPLQAKWYRISAPPLPRSSHTLNVVNGRAYIFGGELQPREPVDNDMHVFILPSATVMEADYKSIPAKASTKDSAVPEKRVGHTAAVIGERIFVFGGRGGKDMKALEEKGRVWVFDTRTDLWSFLDPPEGMPYPAARSYHASVALEKPEPGPAYKPGINPVEEETPAGLTADNAKSEEAGHGTVFIHAGCPATGRTNDLWGFDVHSRTWKEFPAAPGKARGGTSLAVSKSRIYRYGGFNGEGEEGGQVDFLQLAVDTFADLSGEGQGEIALTSKSPWDSLVFDTDAQLNYLAKESGAREAPGNRSVAGLHTITIGMGREYLVLLLGERDPSSMGHDGAGKFWEDVWAFQVPPEGNTLASWKDATLQALGRETGEGQWSQILVADAEGNEGDDVRKLVPGERGWFASSSMGELDPSAIILWGGLNGKNEREDNGWILRIH
jgi:Kelch motif